MNAIPTYVVAAASILLACCGAGSALGADRLAPPVAKLMVDPPVIELVGPGARVRLVVSAVRVDGRLVDRSADAKLSAADTARVRIDDGTVFGVRDGATDLTVSVDGVRTSVPVRVSQSTADKKYHFERDILPILSRHGCNSSGCHGKVEGQGGFNLSVFGFDPDGDRSAIVKEARGRRVMVSAPDHSLLLQKASGRATHGGGIRIPAGSDAYETLRGWIAAGSASGALDVPTVASITVTPAERTMAFHGTQRIRVTAAYTDGHVEDVSHLAKFQTNSDTVANVSAVGTVSTFDKPGQAAVTASFMNRTAVLRVLVPRGGETAAFDRRPVNFIDEKVDAQLRKLNIRPTPLSSDLTFLRRVYIDLTGQLPTPNEIRKFLGDPAADKRAKLIDRLIDQPEFADLWALRWADVLRVNRQVLGHQHAYGFYRWIRDQVAKDVPLDEFARALLTAEGPIDEVPPAAFYKVVPKPGEAANSLSQVFLGVRIACAECHHHPSDRWGQDDYFGMAAFFQPLSVKKVGQVDVVSAKGQSTARHLRSGKLIPAAPLGEAAVAVEGDQRAALARWMTDPKNPYFSRNLANRIWREYFHRGIVDPIDDMRATNPPTNPALLDALADHLVEKKFHLKELVRTICRSQTYQAGYEVDPTNAGDEQNFSRTIFRRPDAEVLLDLLCQVTGVPERFDGMPPGTKAVQVWDSRLNHPFLRTFGRPPRMTACECERSTETNLSGVLALLNGETFNSKIRHENGTVARWNRTIADPAKLAEEMFLTVLTRYPTPQEAAEVTKHLERHVNKRREAVEDVMWALTNTKEFLFVR